MKTKTLLLFLAVVITAGLFFVKPTNNKEYIPRQELKATTGMHGAYEWLSRRKVNPITNTIDIKDVENAKSAILSNRLKKSANSLNLQWVEKGPDNIGGRCRAILIDNEDADLMFAGGVAGGLFKSTSGGSSWNLIKFDEDGLSEFQSHAISSITQASNGDIYVGTGEGMFGNHGENHHTPMIMGQGVYKSSDRGVSFARLSSTWTSDEQKDDFVIVNEIAADPTNSSIVYAATRGGLKVSADAGATWTSPSFSVVGYESRPAQDVAVASDGSVVASVGNNCFIKPAGTNEFVIKSGSADNLISSAGVGRLEFAISPDDPNYMYCMAARTDGTLSNIYQSKDKGQNWVIIGGGGSADFQPMGTQGTYDNVIAVVPGKPGEVWIGGLNMWYGYSVVGTDLFGWTQVSQWYMGTTHPIYVHADQHVIKFHPTDSLIMYIGSDGGISRATANVGFNAINYDFNVTQFFTVGYSPTGNVIGGTQDNGTIYINGEGNSTMSGNSVMGGDGAYALISRNNPDILFFTIYYGGLERSSSEGPDAQKFYSQVLRDYHGFVDGEDWTQNNREGSFVTPIALWETDIDPNPDVIKFIANREYHEGEEVIFDSHNCFKQPLYVTIPVTDTYAGTLTYKDGDTIFIPDPYQSIFALGLARQLWITRQATNFTDQVTRWDWWPIIGPGILVKDNATGNHEDVEGMEFSNDGDILYFTTNHNKLYRCKNISLARSRETASAYADSKLQTVNTDAIIETEMIKSFGNRAITGIGVDPNNADRLIVTLGNYGYDEYVYYSENASGQVSGTTVTFTSKQGNLPKMPVFSGIFNWDDDNTVLLGTEYGVFSTTDITAATPSWNEENSGLESVPVFMIRQQFMPNWKRNVENHGHLYIGTHARGIFESSTLAGPVGITNPKVNLNKADNVSISIYPNPVADMVTLNLNWKDIQDVEIQIFDLQGKLIRQIQNHSNVIGGIQFDVSELKTGTYIVKVSAGIQTGTTKLLKL